MRNYDFAERDDLIDENVKLKEEIYLLEGVLATAENKLDALDEKSIEIKRLEGIINRMVFEFRNAISQGLIHNSFASWADDLARAIKK